MGTVLTNFVIQSGKWLRWEMSGIPQGKQIVVLDKGVSDNDIIVAIVFCKRTSGELHGIIYRPWDHLDLESLVQYEGKKFNVSLQTFFLYFDNLADPKQN